MTNTSLTEAEVAELPYRPGVGILLLNKNGLVFVAQRIDTRAEAWHPGLVLLASRGRHHPQSLERPISGAEADVVRHAVFRG